MGSSRYGSSRNEYGSSRNESAHLETKIFQKCVDSQPLLSSLRMLIET